MDNLADIVQAQDPDRFLAASLVPDDVYDDILALIAFNHEIASAKDKVSETLIGHMRLQWWHDIVDQCFEGKAKANPQIQGLYSIISKGTTDAHLYHALIEAREDEMDHTSIATLSDLRAFATKSAYPLMALTFQIGGYKEEKHTQLAQAIARIWAITGIMRATPFHLQKRRLYIPDDMIEKHNLSKPDLFELRNTHTLAPAVLDCLKCLEPDFQQAKTILKQSDRSLIAFCGLLAMSKSYGAQIAKLEGDVFNTAMASRPLGRIFRLLWAQYFKSIPGL